MAAKAAIGRTAHRAVRDAGGDRADARRGAAARRPRRAEPLLLGSSTGTHWVTPDAGDRRLQPRSSRSDPLHVRRRRPDGDLRLPGTAPADYILSPRRRPARARPPLGALRLGRRASRRGRRRQCRCTAAGSPAGGTHIRLQRRGLRGAGDGEPARLHPQLRSGRARPLRLLGPTTGSTHRPGPWPRATRSRPCTASSWASRAATAPRCTSARVGGDAFLSLDPGLRGPDRAGARGLPLRRAAGRRGRHAAVSLPDRLGALHLLLDPGCEGQVTESPGSGTCGARRSCSTRAYSPSANTHWVTPRRPRPAGMVPGGVARLRAPARRPATARPSTAAVPGNTDQFLSLDPRAARAGRQLGPARAGCTPRRPRAWRPRRCTAACARASATSRKPGRPPARVSAPSQALLGYLRTDGPEPPPEAAAADLRPRTPRGRPRLARGRSVRRVRFGGREGWPAASRNGGGSPAGGRDRALILIGNRNPVVFAQTVAGPDGPLPRPRVRPGKNRIFRAGFRATARVPGPRLQPARAASERAGGPDAARDQVRAPRRPRAFPRAAAGQADPARGQADRPAGLRRRPLAHVRDHAGEPQGPLPGELPLRAHRTRRGRSGSARGRAARPATRRARPVSKVVRVRVR